MNIIDTGQTTTLFTSIDPTGAERDAEYLCLSTTDAVVWLDARDGQLVLSWKHMRHGETLEVRALATETGNLNGIFASQIEAHKNDVNPRYRWSWRDSIPSSFAGQSKSDADPYSRIDRGNSIA